jgi:hypothetical protein
MTIVQRIGATTEAGLKVRCEIDASAYPEGVEVEDDEMAALDIHGYECHGDRNDTIGPHNPN